MIQKRQIYVSSTAWEPKVGYARMVRVGTQLWISGTTATCADGQLVGCDDAYVQTQQALKNIGAALKRAGATFQEVVRTRMYVVNIASDWEPVGRAHGEVFTNIKPATTMVEVRALIDTHMLVEIEADVIIMSRVNRRTQPKRANRSVKTRRNRACG